MSDDDVVQVTHCNDTRRKFVIDYDRLAQGHPSRFRAFLRPKPYGVWFSFGNRWKRFVKDEMPEESAHEWRFGHRMKFFKKDLLCIETIAALDAFEAKYLVEYNPPKIKDHPELEKYSLQRGPDWTKVVNDPANRNIIGVLLRLSALNLDGERRIFGWTYAWDVDSVVVFGPRP